MNRETIQSARQNKMNTKHTSDIFSLDLQLRKSVDHPAIEMNIK